jgi:hypothetical protein
MPAPCFRSKSMSRAFCVVLLVLFGCLAAGHGSPLDRLRTEFRDPPRKHGQYPFWFWNGDLTEEEILRQIAWMEEKGVYGFTIHARMGLSREVGYMTRLMSPASPRLRT